MAAPKKGGYNLNGVIKSEGIKIKITYSIIKILKAMLY
jgi:hypothetical protein